MYKKMKPVQYEIYAKLRMFHILYISRYCTPSNYASAFFPVAQLRDVLQTVL